ncbi:MAG: FecR family protein [Methyloceanibacter sp.]
MRWFCQRVEAPARRFLAPRLGLGAVLGLLLAAHLAGAAGTEGADPVGRVNKVQNAAQVISASGPAAAVIGTEVRMKDELRTGADARLQVTFRDNTVLTLGENARLIIDRYVYEPERGIGEAALKAAAGAFLFATGRMNSLKDKNILVSTPLATIGVRGTEFWGGPIDGQYGVFLIEGEITVTSQGGSVTLSGGGQGTDIPSARFARRRFGVGCREGCPGRRDRVAALKPRLGAQFAGAGRSGGTSICRAGFLEISVPCGHSSR